MFCWYNEAYSQLQVFVVKIKNKILAEIFGLKICHHIFGLKFLSINICTVGNLMRNIIKFVKINIKNFYAQFIVCRLKKILKLKY